MISFKVTWDQLKLIPGDMALVPVLKDHGFAVEWDQFKNKIISPPGRELTWEDNYGYRERIFSQKEASEMILTTSGSNNGFIMTHYPYSSTTVWPNSYNYDTYPNYSYPYIQNPPEQYLPPKIEVKEKPKVQIDDILDVKRAIDLGDE